MAEGSRNNGHDIQIDGNRVETGGATMKVTKYTVVIYTRCVVVTGRGGLTQHMWFFAVNGKSLVIGPGRKGMY